MYKFSTHHWAQRLPQQQMVGDGPKIVAKPILPPLRHVVNAAIGCSLELLETICQIVDIVPGDGQQYTEEEVGLDASTARHTLRQLELQLDNIKHHVSVVSGKDGDDGEDKITANMKDTNNTEEDKKTRPEAESRLYHMAAQVYHRRLGRGLD